MEPDLKRSIAPSPPPAIDQEKGHTPSSLSSETAGKNDRDALSLHSAVLSPVVKDDTERKEEQDVELAHATSKASSVRPPPVKIARANRRGLFARFTILAEVEEPKDYPRKTKWLITFIIAMAAIAAPLGSAIILREQDVLEINGASIDDLYSITSGHCR